MKGILFVEGGGHFLLLWIDHKARVQVLFHPAGISFSGSLCSGLLGVSTELPARYMSQDNFFFSRGFFFSFCLGVRTGLSESKYCVKTNVWRKLKLVILLINLLTSPLYEVENVAF